MIGLSLHQAKATFFDRELVMRRMHAATRKALSRFGAYVRQRARSSIRKRKRPSAPGSPPSSHTGILKQFILFAYEPEKRSVVVGPAKTNQVFFAGDGQPVQGTVPGILEQGGEVRILEVYKWGQWRRMDLRSRRRANDLPTRLRTVRIEARPYMQPAFDAELPRGLQLFRAAA